MDAASGDCLTNIVALQQGLFLDREHTIISAQLVETLVDSVRIQYTKNQVINAFSEPREENRALVAPSSNRYPMHAPSLACMFIC